MNTDNIIWWRVWLSNLLILMVFVIVYGLVTEIAILKRSTLDPYDYFKIVGLILATLTFFWWGRRK